MIYLLLIFKNTLTFVEAKKNGIIHFGLRTLNSIICTCLEKCTLKIRVISMKSNFLINHSPGVYNLLFNAYMVKKLLNFASKLCFKNAVNGIF